MLFQKVPVDILPHCKSSEAVLADFVIMLSPFAPCFAEELWSGLRSVATNTQLYKWVCITVYLTIVDY